MAIDISWIDNKKERYKEVPWMVFDYPGYEFIDERGVIKVWQNDSTQDYARWMCASSGPGTHGSLEYGDAYVRDVLTGARLVKVLGEEPTDEQRAEMERLAVSVLSKADPMAAMGF